MWGVSCGRVADLYVCSGAGHGKAPIVGIGGCFNGHGVADEWAEIKTIFRQRFRDAMGEFLITMLATVIFDLTTAIMIGIICAALFFLRSSSQLTVDFSRVENEKFRRSGRKADVSSKHPDTYVVYVTGPVFFANVSIL